MAEFSLDSLVEFLNQNNVPEIMLLIMGVVALAIVHTYRDNKESKLYKTMMLIGVIVGAFMVYVAMVAKAGWTPGTKIILIIACFALISRPFRNVNLAVIAGLIVAAAVYIYLPTVTGDLEGILKPLNALHDGWPRIICSLVVGALVYLILKFITDAVLLFGKILNAWPFLLVIGIWCILEAIFLIMGYGSIYDFIAGLVHGKTSPE